MNLKNIGTLFFLLAACFLSAAEPPSNDDSGKKVVWFLAGHMQDIFGDEYLETMLRSGYDLKPMHQLRDAALKAGYDLKLADPNAKMLKPFSHVESGIPAVEEKRRLAGATLGTQDPTLRNFDYLIVFEVMPHQLNYLKEYPKEKLILFLWEPPSVMPRNYERANHQLFSKVYTWNDKLVDNKKYFKFHYPVLHPMKSDLVDFESKKLCTLIAGNLNSNHPNELYTERRKLIEFFEKNHSSEIDLYGKWWPETYKTYKGAIDNKISCLKYYKFGIAYENIKDIPGYITEKIFNCFQAGCVPVYLGASNIALYIPKSCYIDRRDFDNDTALYEYMQGMTRAQYEQYIENIQKFLTSDQAQKFSSDHFVKTVMDSFRDKQL
jgi:alpha(1,3/1,4) fucosyltransferase